MIKANRIHLIVVVLVIAALACNLPSNQPPVQDPNAAFTAAAQTIAVQLTNAALSQPAPTNTSLPTATLLPTNTIPAFTIAPPPTLPSATTVSSCDNGLFVADISVPDNTIMTPGEAFTKTWRIKNVGTCSWTPSYAVVFASGNQMSGPSAQALTSNVNPGQTVDISVNMVAPSTNGTYTGYWRLRNASGILFSSFYVQIKVSGGGGGGVIFTVTSVSYSVTGSCGGFHIVAYITTNGAGTVEYYWEFNGNDPVEGTYGSTLNFSSAGTKATPVLDWYITASGNHFAQVYIQSPNNEFIGQANVHCP
jgi:hypothetical protein